MDLATDGQRLYVAKVNGRRVEVNGRSTLEAPAPLMGERVAVSPDGVVAVCARTAADKGYACLLGKPWTELGPTAQLQGIAWIGDGFVCARIGPGGATLVEQTVGGSIFSTRPANTSQGILYYDVLKDWVIKSQAETPVAGYRLIKAIRRGPWYCGQATNPDRLVIVKNDGSVAFKAGPQPETPLFVVIGDTLVCNGPTEFRPPYPTVDVTPVPPPVPPSVPPKPEPPPMPEIPNHKATVAKYRALFDFMPAGSERAWTITNATAWELRAEGAGILHKPSGHNWKGYATDIVVYPDGRHFDVLEDGEGKAGPKWSLVTKPPTVDPARWRAPLNPNVAEPPTPNPPPQPPPPPAPKPPVVDYGAFVGRESQEVHDRYLAVHGRPPAAPDLYHNAWRRLVERWSHADILKDIK